MCSKKNYKFKRILMKSKIGYMIYDIIITLFYFNFILISFYFIIFYFFMKYKHLKKKHSIKMFFF